MGTLKHVHICVCIYTHSYDLPHTQLLSISLYQQVKIYLTLLTPVGMFLIYVCTAVCLTSLLLLLKKKKSCSEHLCTLLCSHGQINIEEGEILEAELSDFRGFVLLNLTSLPSRAVILIIHHVHLREPSFPFSLMSSVLLKVFELK